MSNDHVTKNKFKKWTGNNRRPSMYNDFHDWAKAVSDVLRYLERGEQVPEDKRLWKSVGKDPKEPPPPPPDLE